MEWKERIERIEKEVIEIRKFVNDMSHTVARVEDSIEWIKVTITWVIGLIAGCFGLMLSSIIL